MTNVSPSLSLGVREDAAWVMQDARWVSLDDGAIATVARRFAQQAVPIPTWNDQLHFTDGSPRTANYLLVLDGLNFSFWGDPRWHFSYRGEHLRGYWALAAALKAAIEAGIPVDDARFMASCTLDQLKEILPGDPPIPLLTQRLAHLNELGASLLAHYDGLFVNAIAQSRHSAVALAQRVIRDFPSFEDTSLYRGRTVRIYKRAQILVADLWGAYHREGPGRFDDIAELTAFADYKVPQVLEQLGIIKYAPDLERRILQGVELPHGSEEEVEIRLATVEAVERLRTALAAQGRPVTAIEVDWILWEMGLAPDVNAARPYHLTRTTAY